MKAMNYNEFEARVRATPRGKGLKMSEIYHLFLLYRATNEMGG